jgi:hypothetical protein
MLSEADTRAKLLDPGLHARGWTEDLIRREETAGAIELSFERIWLVTFKAPRTLHTGFQSLTETP